MSRTLPAVSNESRPGPSSQPSANGNNTISSQNMAFNPASIENMIRNINNQSLLQLNSDQPINFESLNVLRAFMNFLERDTETATEFLRMVLTREPIAEKALNVLVNTSRFESKLFEVYNSHATKLPMELIQVFMNESSKCFMIS